MMKKVTNKFGIELKIGDKLQIVSDKLGNKMLANVDKDEVISITGFSEDGKILYHNNSLALPVNSDVYIKI
jgi:predicted mannosyl-3-phosphoglycerate phosphatase (HAD superfamily)